MAGERKKLQRDLARHLRDQDRAKLKKLRAAIELAQVNKRAALTAARDQCRAARLELKERLKLQREEMRDLHRRKRRQVQTACETGRTGARELGRLEQADAQRKLREETRLQRQVRDADKRGLRLRSTARERLQEDDDAVRSNLPAELVPVFDQVRRKIKGGPRKSRTEAFLEWAEENPGEIVAMQQADADAYLAKLLREEKEHGAAMRKAGRYRKDAAELRKALASGEVPF